MEPPTAAPEEARPEPPPALPGEVPPEAGLDEPARRDQHPALPRAALDPDRGVPPDQLGVPVEQLLLG